jgi:hypothetical protein
MGAGMIEFIQQQAQVLGLKYPVEVRLCFRDSPNDAEYIPRFNGRGDLKRHVIKLFIAENNNRDFETLIIHELIHAYQEENKIVEIHGKSFAKMAARFPDYPEVYIPEIDE